MDSETIFVANDARISIEPSGGILILIPSKRVMISERPLGEWDAAVMDELGNPLVCPALDGTMGAALRWAADLPELPTLSETMRWLETQRAWDREEDWEGTTWQSPGRQDVRYDAAGGDAGDRRFVADVVAIQAWEAHPSIDITTEMWTAAIERIKGA